MKKCEDIKNNLPLYLDDSLSGTDKKAVEEHLKVCPQCTGTLSQLSKTETLINSLNTVEPPPWFKQKIMARVREEAEKKSFVQKLFYPLRIKIPVQIFASICIAVLAVYIYKSGEEQMKEVVPSFAPVPVIEVQKSQISGQKENKFTDKEIKGEDKPIQKKKMPREIIREKVVFQAKDLNEQTSSDIKADKFEGAPAPQSVALPEAAVEKKKESSVLGASMKADRAPQAQDSVIKPNLLLKVSDVDVAAGEVEKILVIYEAKNRTRQMNQGKVIITGELKNQKIKDLINKLKTIGLLEYRNLSADNLEGRILIVIEIENK